MTAATSATQLPRPGDIVGGKYVVDRLIGQGGMGAVFAAKHRKLGQSVAIKVMLADPSNPEAAHRFINEARAAANIQNEHVVRVDDVDEEMGYAYMVLELLEGEDLGQVLEREKRLPPQVAVSYVIQALKGVGQAHHLGLVHRDLKPSNLFLARRKDGSVIVKVLDFGISKASNASGLAQSPSALTSTKAMLGSPLYMSPEQLRSSKSVDHRADLWAIGIILYELVTGTLPFMGESLGELFAAILESDPLPVRSHVPEVSPELEAVILRCLQRRPDNRFQSAADVTQALLPFVPGMSGAGMSGAFGISASNLGGTAVLGPLQSGAHSIGQVTPSGGGPLGRQPGAVTGSGPRVIGGTMHMGNTPQPAGGTPQPVQTGSHWHPQATTGATPKSKLPLVLGIAFGAFALFGISIGAVAVLGSKAPRPAEITSAPTPLPTESAPAPKASATAATGTSTTDVTPVTTATATVAATATTLSHSATSTPTSKHHTPTPTKPDPQPTTSKSDATKPPPPPPKPTSTSKLQDVR